MGKIFGQRSLDGQDKQICVRCRKHTGQIRTNTRTERIPNFVTNGPPCDSDLANGARTRARVQ